MKNRKWLKYAAAAVVLSAMLAFGGCGEQPAGTVTTSQENPVADSGSDNGNAGETTGNPAAGENASGEGTATPSTTGTHLESLAGEWQYFAGFGDGYVDFAEEMDAKGSIHIYEENGKYKIDYFLHEYDCFRDYCGMSLVEESGTYFKDEVKADWYARMVKKHDEGNVVYSMASTTEDTLTVQVHSVYKYENYETGEPEVDEYDYYYLYVKEGCQRLEEIEHGIRYPETVTVSNVQELYAAIGNGKHIILKAGTYNISDLTEADKAKNPDLNFGYFEGEQYEIGGDTIELPFMRNIIIEGEEGAKVLICTEDYSVAPLAFFNCNKITLKNLTLGHEVEPGHCTGSVLNMDYCGGMEVDHCNLYGSGTYGIEATYTNELRVSDTDIYDCTYGAINLIDCNEAHFEKCKFRDSREYSILDIPECSSIYFNDCEITGNESGKYCALIDARDTYSVSFTNCKFKDNKYEEFSIGENITFEKCDM